MYETCIDGCRAHPQHSRCVCSISKGYSEYNYWATSIADKVRRGMTRETPRLKLRLPHHLYFSSPSSILPLRLLAVCLEAAGLVQSVVEKEYLLAR